MGFNPGRPCTCTLSSYNRTGPRTQLSLPDLHRLLGCHTERSSFVFSREASHIEVRKNVAHVAVHINLLDLNGNDQPSCQVIAFRIV